MGGRYKSCERHVACEKTIFISDKWSLLKKKKISKGFMAIITTQRHVEAQQDFRRRCGDCGVN